MTHFTIENSRERPAELPPLALPAAPRRPRPFPGAAREARPGEMLGFSWEKTWKNEENHGETRGNIGETWGKIWKEEEKDGKHGEIWKNKLETCRVNGGFTFGNVK